MMQLLLIVMLALGVSSGKCPTMCKCRNYPGESATVYYTSVTCGVYVENVTHSLENATRDFQVSNLNQDEVEQVLSGLVENEMNLPYLNHLSVTKSEVEQFNASTQGLQRLLSLTLTDNHLETIPELFVNLTNLESLDLSRNDIKVLELESFRTLGKLEVLNLSANSLNRVHRGSFGGISNLKCLDLSGNNLTALDDQALTPLPLLQYLNLSNNRLEVLNEACFSGLVMLQQLDVSWNRLARVAPGSLQLPSLARLMLAGNPQLGMSREVAVLVGTGRKLQTVDASRTGLKQVPAALTHSIRTLRLAGNSIRTVSCGDVDSYPLLQLLDFSSNNLESIEEDALGRLDYLSVLYLTDNNIREVPRSLPEKLKVLHLEHNNVERVSERDFKGLAGLEVLLLSDNNIETIQEAAFAELLSLVTLDLSRNPISILEPGSLQGPSALQVLRLASIGTISPAEEVSFPLSAPEHLITLDLSDSPGLARQLLADTAALAAARELQELDLSRTGLSLIRSDLLHYLPQLRALHVKDNSLNCSGLEWLAEWMRRQNEKEYGGIVCANPPDLWGTPLVDLQEAEILPIETINHDGRIVNLSKENDTNMYRTSGNVTGQYTTESTNYITLSSVENVTVFMENVTSYFRNISKEVDKNPEITNEIEKVSARKIYFGIKDNADAIRNALKQTLMPSSTISTMKNNKKAIEEQQTTILYSIVNLGHKSNSKTTDLNSMSYEIIKNIPEPGKSTDYPLTSPENETFNNTEATDSDITESSMSWNASTGETSMYTNSKQEVNFMHPGMLILAAGALGAAAAFAMLAARFTRKNRNSCRQEDIEVSSLPSVSELW